MHMRIWNSEWWKNKRTPARYPTCHGILPDHRLIPGNPEHLAWLWYKNQTEIRLVPVGTHPVPVRHSKPRGIGLPVFGGSIVHWVIRLPFSVSEWSVGHRAHLPTFLLRWPIGHHGHRTHLIHVRNGDGHCSHRTPLVRIRISNNL